MLFDPRSFFCGGTILEQYNIKIMKPNSLIDTLFQEGPFGQLDADLIANNENLGENNEHMGRVRNYSEMNHHMI